MNLSSNANYVVSRGVGQKLVAADLCDEHLGHGLYREQFRDFEWLYIVAVHKTEQDVTIEYLIVGEPTKSHSVRDDNTMVDTEERIVERKTLRYRPEEEVVVSTSAEERPKGRRITKTALLEWLEECTESSPVVVE